MCLLVLVLSACSQFANFTPIDTFGFTLDETESQVYSESLTFSQKTDFQYRATWTRSGLPLEIGLVNDAGTEYSVVLESGSCEGKLSDIPAGSYQLYARNTHKQADFPRSKESVQIQGVVAFDY